MPIIKVNSPREEKCLLFDNRIKMDNFELKALIGKGSFGRVYLVKFKMS